MGISDRILGIRDGWLDFGSRCSWICAVHELTISSQSGWEWLRLDKMFVKDTTTAMNNMESTMMFDSPDSCISPYSVAAMSSTPLADLVFFGTGSTGFPSKKSSSDDRSTATWPTWPRQLWAVTWSCYTKSSRRSRHVGRARCHEGTSQASDIQ